VKSVSGKTKNPRHYLVFLSFDWAKDQTLYGKDGLRALPKLKTFFYLYSGLTKPADLCSN
jgi:hypothetical protein